jgi:perosamine synthetase
VTSRRRATGTLPEAGPGAVATSGVVPLSEPEVGELERRWVDEALATGWVSSAGPFVDRFERDVAKLLGVRNAVATASGTAALHVALLLAGVRPGDEVLVSTLSFVAPANAVRYAAAYPVFVDCEPDFWQLDAALLADFLERSCERRGREVVNRASGRRVAALLPVHALGHPFDAEAVLDVARRFDLPVVEDAAEGLGARCRGVPLGRLGDVAALSFNGNKIVTSGGGGMVVTERDDWAERARYLTTTAKDDPIESVHGEVGFNYRLSNVSAALGAAQLTRLDEFLSKKRAIADRYTAAFAAIPSVDPMREAPWAASSFWLYTVRIAGGSRPLLRALMEAGVEARPVWQPLHLSPAHDGAQVVRGKVAERVYDEALSLPSSASLGADDQHRVIEAVRTHMGGAR